MELDIDFKCFKDEEVLFFIRIKGKKQYFNLFYPETFLNKFEKLKSYRTISEYNYDADIIIDISKYPIHALSTNDFVLINGIIDFDSTYKRCRGLRAIHLHEAMELVYRVSKYFIEFYKSSPVKLIIAGTVDNYVMDIMFQIAKHYNVTCIGITDFFLYPDYKLITNYGENNKFRVPNDEEVLNIYNKLINKSKSPLAISSRKAIKNAIWDCLSFYYRLTFRYLLKYKLLGNLGYEYRFAYHLKNFHKPSQIIATFYFDKFNLKKIEEIRENVVYMPLHWYPEATIDYWTDEPVKADYFHYLVKVITFFKEIGKTIIIKEHPAFYLARPLVFYKELKRFNNVILINPFISTQLLFDLTDDIIIWNGSTGVEAIMANKNVYVTTNSYYSKNLLPFYTNYGKPKKFTEIEKKELIRDILQTTLKV